MKPNISHRIIFFILSLVFQFLVLSAVVSRTVNNMSLILWFSSMILFYVAFPFKAGVNLSKVKRQHKFNIKAYIPAILIIIFALGLRISLMTNDNIFHSDEYISSYFSYSIGDLSSVDWFGVYPIPHNWIWQFPLQYFFFQKLFFNIFGISTLLIRLSIVPYLIITFFSLFLIVKNMYSSKAAYVSILFLAFFSPDLYLSRWSMHFYSSIAFFLLATLFFILSIKNNKKIYFALFGFFLGLCYMTYFISYVAFPLFFLYFLTLIFLKQINKSTIKNMLLGLVIFIFTISPILTYALKVDNFFMNRASQIKLINGSWSPYQNVEINFASVSDILLKQVNISIRSLYEDKISGASGYNFGHLALFDPVTFIAFIVSVIYFVYIFVRRKDSFSMFVLLTIIVSFINGLILAMPPPSFQRLTLIFSFVALILGVTVVDLSKYIFYKHKRIGYYFLIFFIFVIIASNIFQFEKILAVDVPDDPDFPQIQQCLEQNNQKKFYIAAFSTYGLNGVIFIRSKGTMYSITNQLPDILSEIPKNKTSFLVILYPNEKKIMEVKNVFPSATIVNNYRTHMIIRIN
jgi:hypothetical protein